MEYVKFMTATGDARQSNQFKLNAFGTMMAKLEERQQDTINTLKETVSYLLGEIVTLKSQVAALDRVVDTVTPAPIFAPAPATPAQAPAPPPPRPIPPLPPLPAAPSWATVTRKGKKKATAPPPIVMTAAGPVESFHHQLAPVESYSQYLARMSRSSNSAPAPKKQQQQQQNTSPPLRTRRLLVKRDGSELQLSALQLRDALNKALG